jgi:hypothetical protein
VRVNFLSSLCHCEPRLVGAWQSPCLISRCSNPKYTCFCHLTFGLDLTFELWHLSLRSPPSLPPDYCRPSTTAGDEKSWRDNSCDLVPKFWLLTPDSCLLQRAYRPAEVDSGCLPSKRQHLSSRLKPQGMNPAIRLAVRLRRRQQLWLCPQPLAI